MLAVSLSVLVENITHLIDFLDLALPEENISWVQVTTSLHNNRRPIDYLRRWPLVRKKLIKQSILTITDSNLMFPNIQTQIAGEDNHLLVNYSFEQPIDSINSVFFSIPTSVLTYLQSVEVTGATPDALFLKHLDSL